MKPIYRIALLLFGIAILAGVLVWQLQQPEGARGKSPALPITMGDDPENQLAQDLALTDGRVIDYTAGRRAEVFSILEVGSHYPASAAACADSDCRQVDIYNFDENFTLSVIVDIEDREVLEVLHQPGILAVANKRMVDVAIRIIREAPEVIAELGYQPAVENVYPMPASLAGTECGSTHPCVAANFQLGDRIFWAHVDLTTETLAGTGWSPAPAEDWETVSYVPQGCPPSGSVNRDGWELDHSVTASDGLRLADVTFNGVPVLTSVKLVEWHADYGSSGFVDATGCGGGGGGKFSIFPYGDTQVLDILDDNQNVIGFEVVQDFRMSSWGQTCNYRYEQHDQFYLDGRFRIVGGAYGKGCGTNSMYRPLIRIDLAVGGDAGDLFSTWDGSVWVDRLTEFWLLQSPPYTLENYAWKVTDQISQQGYYIEPGQGQFGDGGRGDDAFIYVVQHHAAEGDANMSAVGSCCNNNQQQGPDTFLNSESINGQNIVLWYVPQFQTDVTPGKEYCWTIQGEPNPITYPCFGGPMFHPFSLPITPTVTPSATATATATSTATSTPTPTATMTPGPPPDNWIYLPIAPKDWQ